MTIIAKRYAQQHELGVGGMGTVYLGLDTQTNQAVAIKALKTDIARPDTIERFKREGEALRALDHPNIVKMLDAVEYDGQHYLIMEYVGGGDLSERIAQAPITHQRCVNMAMDIADALTRAHRLDIIHRDLKPANILIGEDGVLRLTDFGVAYVGDKERVTDPDAIVGTIDYLPPEVFDDARFDVRGDIWAFGVMLFEMLAGKRPFGGVSLVQTIHAITTQPIPDLEVICPDAPTALVDLIYRMLEKDPQARISSVRHVGAVLEDILQGRESQSAHEHHEPRFATPIPAPQEQAKHNLPVQVTPFVGREHELAELDTLINDPTLRLVSILAPGGMGKTRFAIETARQAQSQFADGVYLVELAPLMNHHDIVPAIADALGYHFQGDGREPLKQVVDVLKGKQSLLVLDNYEHLLEGADIVSEILQATEQVKILVTSRQRLGQRGETLFHLGGLDFPAWETSEDAFSYTAVKLFMNSAKRVRPDFVLGDDDLEAVAHICTHVAGMPLGIVLSASWLAILTPQEIVAEMTQNMDFLATDEGELPERQRSIEAVMDYSWRQMTDAEQQVFMKLSVFRGGFTRESAQSVAGASLRVLMSLANKSLLRRDADSGRYAIHELLRQFAETKLKASADNTKMLRQYCDYIFAFLRQQVQVIKEREQQAKVVQAIHDEFGNINYAWGLAVAHGWGDMFKGVGNIWWYFEISGEWEVGLRLLESALNVVAESDFVTRGVLLAGMSVMAFRSGRHQVSGGYSRQAMALLENTDEQEHRFWTWVNLGNVVWHTEGIEQGDAVYAEGEAESMRRGMAHMANAFTSNRAIIARLRGDYALAIDRFETLLETYEADDPWSTVFVLSNLADLHIVLGDLERAEASAKRLIEITTDIQMHWMLLHGYRFLCEIHFRRGDDAKLQANIAKRRALTTHINQPQPAMDPYHIRLQIRDGKFNEALQGLLQSLPQMPFKDNDEASIGLALAEFFMAKDKHYLATQVLELVSRYGELDAFVVVKVAEWRQKNAAMMSDEKDVEIATTGDDQSAEDSIAILQRIRAELEAMRPT
jgi:predicted ATPase